jgi:hypothetical protein
MKQPSYLDSIPLTTSEVSSVKSEPASPHKKLETGLEAGKTVTSILAFSSSSSDSRSSVEFPSLKSPGKETQPEHFASQLAVQIPAKEPIPPLSPILEAEVETEEEESWSGVLLAVGAALLGGVLVLRLMQE